MNGIMRRSDALLLEDFDIRNQAKREPLKEIGVSTNRIYIQIAKISGNQNRKHEFAVLLYALRSTKENNLYKYPTYVPMKMCDVVVCFNKCLKTLPKSTFIEL